VTEYSADGSLERRHGRRRRRIRHGRGHGGEFISRFSQYGYYMQLTEKSYAINLRVSSDEEGSLGEPVWSEKAKEPSQESGVCVLYEFLVVTGIVFYI